MPQRRRIKKGSFGGHFDELVTQFPHEEPAQRDQQDDRPKPSKDDGSIHDKLFESGWSKARGSQPSSFSNQ